MFLNQQQRYLSYLSNPLHEWIMLKIVNPVVNYNSWHSQNAEDYLRKIESI